MISSFYISLLVIIIIALSAYIIRLRRKYQISLGDGGNDVLIKARSAHANAVEYITVGSILFILTEISTDSTAATLHVIGAILLTGRVLHPYGIIKAKLNARVFSMFLTFSAIAALISLNLVSLIANVASA